MIINANALSIPLADKSVHTIVTSPPYYGLRDYGTAKWEGGDPNCDHLGKPVPTRAGFNERYFGRESSENNKQDALHEPMGQVCSKCGAIRIDEQIGLEVTPDAYIASLVEVFRECKRILRDDGTLWVNIGDSYASNGCYINAWMEKESNKDKHHLHSENYDRYADRKAIRGGEGNIKGKDLIGIPWMLAFALRADGWYLRSDIIWAKKNCMPESVKDRPTKSHEYIFLLSKSAKYYYDSEAIKEPYSVNSNPNEIYNGNATKDYKSASAQNPSDSKRRILESMANGGGRNKRDVWWVSTKPYKGAHYATFNPELIKPCILAGAPETCCAKCGAPYERVVEKETKYSAVDAKSAKAHDRENGDGYYRPNSKETGGVGGLSKIVNQYIQPTCTCDAGMTRGIVFDPFVGSGTTVATAIQLGRRGVGIDLSMKYLLENAKERIDDVRLPLLENAWK